MWEKYLGLPINAAVHGGDIDRLILYVHILMLVLFVGWGLFFAYTVIRFRRKVHPRADPVGVRTHASSYIEGVVALTEVALLVGISIPFWSSKVNAAISETPDTVRIRVIAQQFAWNIHYPGPDGVFGRTDIKLVNEQTNPIGLDRNGDPHAKDDIVTINQLHIPVHTPIICDLTTKDVIHSFALPLLRVKQDTVSGMSIPVAFTATMTSDEVREKMTKTVRLPPKQKLDGMVAMEEYKGADGKVIVRKGRGITDTILNRLVEAGITEIKVGPRIPAEIACAQLCGLGHYRMKGFLTIHSKEGFEAWLKEQAE